MLDGGFRLVDKRNLRKTASAAKEPTGLLSGEPYSIPLLSILALLDVYGFILRVASAGSIKGCGSFTPGKGFNSAMVSPRGALWMVTSIGHRRTFCSTFLMVRYPTPGRFSAAMEFRP